MASRHHHHHHLLLLLLFCGVFARVRGGSGEVDAQRSHDDDALSATVYRRRLRHVPRHLLHRRHVHRVRSARQARQQVNLVSAISNADERIPLYPYLATNYSY